MKLKDGVRNNLNIIKNIILPRLIFLKRLRGFWIKRRNKFMNIEYEATFINIDKNEIRTRLKAVGAQLIKPEFLMKRVVFELPVGHEIPGGWLRVRDEGDKITMSLKVVDGDKIENQKEIQLKIDNFAEGVALLEATGAKQKAFQESRRELWTLDNTEITIDEWPYLEPYVEVEGQSEEIVLSLIHI